MATLNSCNWMSGIDGSVTLDQLSIPGSHESCALYGEVASKCQNFGILRQLVRGIRFLDVRCKYVSDDDANYFFPVHHGPDYQHSDFSTVQKECMEFLTVYDNETILMNVQQAESSESSATYSAKFESLRNPFNWTEPELMPKLGDLRMKMVLIRPCRRNYTQSPPPAIAGWEWPGHGLEWNGFAVSGESFNTLFVTQNYWHGVGGSADGDAGMGDGPGGVGGVTGTFKGQKVEEFLSDAAAGKNPGKAYMNFLSRADSSIGDAASDMNNRIRDFLKAQAALAPGRGYGLLPFDFVGNSGSGPGCLEDRIIGANHFSAGNSFTYPSAGPVPASKFKVQVTFQGRPGWLKEGSGKWAVVSDSPDDYLALEPVPNADPGYFQASDGYLTVNSEGQVCSWNDWNQASTFQKEDRWLFSDYNGGALRIRNGGELWCGNQGDLVEVELVPV
ncbi:MAG TPA: phosphatidylinositol-specific phospholipase C domain-containing protein [Actinomycetota bacterium]|nr:phosphatidylinositol-specific phospholipase C domain-containing protein [Actinomycetota bacterium]